MASPAISREVALRIGLAAKALTPISAADLLPALMKSLDGTLTEDSLKQVSDKELRVALKTLASEDDTDEAAPSDEAIKQAVSYLRGEENALPELPQIQSYEEGDMPGSIRIAIASSSGENVNGHFGSCPRFLIYQLSTEAYRLVDIRSTAEADEAEDKNSARVDLVKDCHVMYIQSVGGPAAAKIVRAGIYPMKKPDGGSAQQTLEELQQVMQGTPPPWLAKVMGKDASKSLRFTDDDEDDED